MPTWLKNAYQKCQEPVVFVLAVLAIIFAIIQFVDSGHQYRKLTDITSRLEPIAGNLEPMPGRLNEIANSMSTRYVGEFPLDIKDVTEVVRGTKKNLDIMVDYVGYGHYSDPAAFDAYLHRIEALRPTVRVRVLVYNSARASQARHRQWPDFEAIKRRPAFAYFFNKLYPSLGVPKTFDEFDQKLSIKQHDYETELLARGVEVQHTPEKLMFYAWLQDDNEAVFSFLDTERDEHEFAFRTSDKRLIGAFRETFESMWTPESLKRN